MQFGYLLFLKNEKTKQEQKQKLKKGKAWLALICWSHTYKIGKSKLLQIRKPADFSGELTASFLMTSEFTIYQADRYNKNR
jgi:hypothetical protein